jgi:hypothetical protein
METKETEKSVFNPQKHFSNELAEAFLKEMCRVGSAIKAASNLGLNRPSLYRWREQHPDFDEAWREADIIINENILSELYRRGHDGYDEPVFWKGEVVGEIRKYSDKCLVFMAGVRMPELRPNRQSLEIGNKPGETLKIANRDVGELTDDELRHIDKTLEGIDARIRSEKESGSTGDKEGTCPSTPA